MPDRALVSRCPHRVTCGGGMALPVEVAVKVVVEGTELIQASRGGSNGPRWFQPLPRVPF
jgi:hypothetical protein